LFELALAADRSYMLHDDNEENVIALSPMNGGPLPMSNGLTRLQTRFLRRRGEGRRHPVAPRGRSTPRRRRRPGSSPFAPDEIDWDDEIASPSKRVPRSRRTR
jgi:benzoyl-CoA-dihydrodiol lyase